MIDGLLDITDHDFVVDALLLKARFELGQMDACGTNVAWLTWKNTN